METMQQNSTLPQETGQGQGKSPLKFFLYWFAIPLAVVIAVVAYFNSLD